MEIHVKRGQEFKKGGFMSGRNVKLVFEANLSLSEQDKRLIEKYYEPDISWIAVAGGLAYIRECYEGTDESFKVVKVDSGEGKLSKFRIVAHVDDGHAYLANIQQFEKAVVRTLVRNLDHLQALEQWQGERTLTSEE